jgi:hypothetical protein
MSGRFLIRGHLRCCLFGCLEILSQLHGFESTDPRDLEPGGFKPLQEGIPDGAQPGRFHLGVSERHGLEPFRNSAPREACISSGSVWLALQPVDDLLRIDQSSNASTTGEVRTQAAVQMGNHGFQAAFICFLLPLSEERNCRGSQDTDERDHGKDIAKRIASKSSGTRCDWEKAVHSGGI